MAEGPAYEIASGSTLRLFVHLRPSLKMHANIIHIAYELFNIKPFRNAVKPFAGLGAALLRLVMISVSLDNSFIQPRLILQLCEAIP